MHSNSPLIDCTNPAARAWWQSIPMKGDGNGTYHGTPVSELIDGVLADSGGFEWYGAGNISVARLEALQDAKFSMLAGLQATLTAANGGMVMANGINMYGGANADPRHPGGNNIQVLDFTNAIMNEHTAVRGILVTLCFRSFPFSPFLRSFLFVIVFLHRHAFPFLLSRGSCTVFVIADIDTLLGRVHTDRVHFWCRAQYAAHPTLVFVVGV